MDIQNIIFGVIAVVVVVLGVVGKSKSDLKKMIYQAMLVAKDKAKDGILKNGQEQKEWVVKRIVDLSPGWLVNFVGMDNLNKMIESLYSGALDLLDDGKLNHSLDKKEE